jgi:DNA-binding NarL/FixJ family response regulator
MLNDINIIIAEDQHLFRQTLTNMLNEMLDFRVLCDVSNGTQLLQFIRSMAPAPVILLLDISLPDINGIDLCELITKDFSWVRIIVVSVHQQEMIIAKLIRLGASAYLNKNADFNVLVQAIRSVHAHKFYIDEHIIKIIQGSHKHYNKELKTANQFDVNLSTREIEVLRLICKELSSNEIAERLFISMRTVDGHRNRLLLKTGCKNVAGLVLFAIKNQLIDLV